MKRNLLFTSIGAAAVAVLFSASVNAQTCASPNMWQPNAAGTPTISDTTCNGEASPGGGFCQSGFNAPGPAYVALSTFAASRTFTTVNFTGGAGYDLAVYVVPQANGCNSNGACQTTGDATTPLNTGDIPDGTYYILMTAADFDGAGACGPVTATSNGSFPVTLQDFTVS